MNDFKQIVEDRMAHPLVSLQPMTIAVFLAESPWGNIDQDAMNKGLGGRETALVCLCMEWARQGHDVYAFVPRQSISLVDHPSGGVVRWIPNSATIEIVEAVQPDIFISWENVEVLKALENYGGITGIEMQVAHLESDGPVSEVADYIFVLSEWAKYFLLSQHPDMPAERVIVLANGAYMSRFKDEVPVPEIFRKEWNSDFHFIYSSSPDRGLHHLLKLWPQIQDLVMSHFETECHLHICYGVENFVAHSRWSHREDANRALAIEEGLKHTGVIYHGKIGQDALSALMLNCDLMLYPADTMSPTETGCISIVEALAAGCPVVTTDCDCIGPDYHEVTTQVPLPWNEKDFLEAIIDALDPEDYQARVEAGREFALTRDWPVIAAQWIEEISSIRTMVI